MLLYVDGERALTDRVQTLFLSIYNETGRVVFRQRAPEQGKAELPGSLVLYPAQSAGELRIHATASESRAFADVIGEGWNVVTLRPGAQVSTSLVLQGGRLPDRDGDGVPDAIDRCDEPDPLQHGCGNGPDAGSELGFDDATVDGARDATRDSDADGPPSDSTRDAPSDSTRDTLGPDTTRDSSIDTAPCTPLSGTYTIDQNGGGTRTYQSFAGAISALRACGVSAATIFNVLAGTYNESGFAFPSVSSASAARPITFRVDAGATVRLVGAQSTYVIRIDTGAHDLTLDGFEIDGSVAANRLTAPYSAPVLFEGGGGQQRIVLRRLHVHDYAPTAWVSSYMGGVYMQITNSVGDITIRECLFERLQVGSTHTTQGVISLRNDTRSNLTIEGNRFFDVNLDAINIRSGAVQGLTIVNNQFVLSGTAAALDFYTGATLSGALYFAYNTVATTQTVFGASFSGTTPLQVVNNIIVGQGASLAGATFGPIDAHHNCYDGASAGTHGDATDVSGSAMLVRLTSPYDLHLASGNSACADQGTPLPNVGTDIDGDQRQSSPDIGSDERP
ncbi:MAG: hypothetical protein KC503_30680 [Myxococcales bacterium]|nr:hypothetical protein [Myxococcales bacterium]